MAYSSWTVVFGEQPSAAKWNILGTNDAYFDGLIGSGTAWANWSPSYTNFTLGNGTLTFAKYQTLGKNTFFRISITIGSTTSISGSMGFSLPVTAVTGVLDGDPMVSNCTYTDAGVATYHGHLEFSSTTVAKYMIPTSNGTYTGNSNVNGTVPLSFQNTDILSATGVYEKA